MYEKTDLGTGDVCPAVFPDGISSCKMSVCEDEAPRVEAAALLLCF